MVQREMNGSTVINICDEWRDVTLKQGVELYKIAMRFPDAVKKIYAFAIEKQTDEMAKEIGILNSSLTDEQLIKTLPILYGEVIKCLTDIDENLVDQLMPTQRTTFYQQYLSRFIIGVLNFPIDLKIKKISSFDFRGQTFYLPTVNRFKIGNLSIEQPMNNVTAIEFTEAADLQLAEKALDGGRIETLSNIIAIHCRLKNEKYDEQKSLSRAELFMDELTMDVAWEVFFCLVELFNTLKKRSQIFLLAAELKKETTPNFNSLDGMLKSYHFQKVQQK